VRRARRLVRQLTAQVSICGGSHLETLTIYKLTLRKFTTQNDVY